ncbi:GTPase-activating protein GYP7 [Ascoidea rubescens DSM 1968]|uniref:RabGAP/TBC n=1 Tax=Ascoidea rubescens DSM 1968 TaxID=1344418 RepID=A0A1D2VRJ7_9ASCO|nr:RabGAP/TBC [Ascoidea rubescens DSM 1968]ODV64231.1 RabGAP/TBC [Ascoidea rubescens DSM 1968]
MGTHKNTLQSQEKSPNLSNGGSLSDAVTNPLSLTKSNDNSNDNLNINLNNSSPYNSLRKKKISTYPPGKAKLLWTKSKVYIHLTKNKSDNISGFLSLIKVYPTSINNEILLTWFPESTLSNSNDRAIFESCDLYINLNQYKSNYNSNNHDNHNFPNSFNTNKKKVFFINSSILQSMGAYSFQTPLSNIFSIQARVPSLGWWWGSIIINSRSQFDTFPILFFHDDESISTQKEQKFKNKDFNPFSSNNEGQLFWGGDQFFTILKKYILVERSSLDSSFFLINPNSDDLNYTKLVTTDYKSINKNDPNNQGANNNNINESIEKIRHTLQNISVNKIVTSAKWTILESLARVSMLAKSKVDELVEENPKVKALLNKPEVVKINNDFDTARVYLAKWALAISEQAEKNKIDLILDKNYQNLLNKELGGNFSNLSIQEISKIHRRKEISPVEWSSFFDSNGNLILTVNEVKERIFHGGLNETIRSQAWLFLLDVVPWDSSTFERNQIIKSLRSDYQHYLNLWKIDIEEKQKDEYWVDQKFRIEKDINRTDRDLSLYKNPKKSSTQKDKQNQSHNKDENNDNDNDNDNDHNDNDDEEHNISNIKNEHLKNLREILITYNEYNQNLGYVQGMTDLLSPLYYIFQDNALSFWCFAKFMERMERNFVRDQSGMKNQMLVLTELVQFMLPELYLHLEKCDSNQLFFFFRMLLVWFKREFEFNDTLRLWEIFWTDYYTSEFHLFFALSILSKHEVIIKRHLRQFDEVLRYINDLALTMDINDLLIRSELLFLRFRRMIEIIDRENDMKERAKMYKVPNESEVETEVETETELENDINNASTSNNINPRINRINANRISKTKTFKPSEQKKPNESTSDKKNKNYKISESLRALLSKEIVVQKEVEREPGMGGG